MDGIKLESESPVPFIPHEVLRQLDSIVGNDSDSIQSGGFFDSSTMSSADFVSASTSNVSSSAENSMSNSHQWFSSTESSTSESNGHRWSSSPESSTSVSNGQQSTLTVDILPNAKTSSCRKRKRQQANWARTIKNNARQKGKLYYDSHGKVHLARGVKWKSCPPNCSFSCSQHFNSDDQQNIHKNFWTLDDKSKIHFYSKNVKRIIAKRKSKVAVKKAREFSYQYYFENHCNKIRVCHHFFLTTLDISERRIYYAYNKKILATTGVAKSPTKGKHIKKVTSHECIEAVKRHIESFPRIESHYCRSTTSREFLDPYLSVRKMYGLYKEKSTGTQVSESIYRKIFNNEYNLAFHVPKKDLCDICCEIEKNSLPTTAENQKFQMHNINKGFAKLARDTDRQITDKRVAIICYDLQNVFSLPKAEIANFYYKRKFSVFNLTGHCNLNKITYCSIWTEYQSGRSGNDIASALNKILNRILVDNPSIEKIILWSDSCVPQNKNRINSLMLLKFLAEHPTIAQIEHKYSTPGHSQIQEVDAVHSVIEWHLRGINICSPASLIPQLRKVQYTNVKLEIMELEKTDFFNYSIASQPYQWIPFAKTHQMMYEKEDLLAVKYKVSLNPSEPFIKIKIFNSCSLRSKTISLTNLPEVKNLKIFHNKIDKNKVADLKSKLKYMDPNDVNYYSSIF